MMTSGVVLLVLFPIVTAVLRAQVDDTALLSSTEAAPFGPRSTLQLGKYYATMMSQGAPEAHAVPLNAMGLTLPEAFPDDWADLILNKVMEADADGETDMFTSRPIVKDGKVDAGISAVITNDHVYLYDDASIRVWVRKEGTEPNTRAPIGLGDIIRLTAPEPSAVAPGADDADDADEAADADDADDAAEASGPSCQLSLEKFGRRTHSCRRQSETSCRMTGGGVCEWVSSGNLVDQAWAGCVPVMEDYHVGGFLVENPITLSTHMEEVNDICNRQGSRFACEVLHACEYVGVPEFELPYELDPW